MDTINYQELFEVMQDILPDQWHKIILYVEYGENSYMMRYYADLGNGEYQDCYKITKYSHKDFIKAYMKIDKVLSKVRNKLSENEKWTIMTVSINADGSFKSDFDYMEIDNKTFEYREKWKEKYLI